MVGHASDLRLTTFDGMEKLTVRWPKRTSTASRCQSGNLQEEKKKEGRKRFILQEGYDHDGNDNGIWNASK